VCVESTERLGSKQHEVMESKVTVKQTVEILVGNIHYRDVRIVWEVETGVYRVVSTVSE